MGVGKISVEVLLWGCMCKGYYDLDFEVSVIFFEILGWRVWGFFSFVIVWSRVRFIGGNQVQF